MNYVVESEYRRTRRKSEILSSSRFTGDFSHAIHLSDFGPTQLFSVSSDSSFQRWWFAGFWKNTLLM
jgi:hypothetical protein